MGVLIEALPADAAVNRLPAGRVGRWSIDLHLLASIVDRLAMLSWQMGGDKKAKKPEMIQRPGGAHEDKVRMSPRELVVRLKDFQRRERERQAELAAQASAAIRDESEVEVGDGS